MAGKSLTTLRTIAEKIGVSTSTVSRVLNGKSRQCRISPQTTRAV
ncbi:MAG TPA: LacI family transcriptional regulator, partial [Phycisphaerales bacterium]|nr:LacI family transcriptional regulator [Phycisphaerales bacterium]